MNDPLRLRTLYAVGMDMAHHVVTHELLLRLRHLIIDILRGALQLCNLFLADVQSELALCLRQGDPEPAPGSEFLLLGKNVLHLL